jgi:uncharacterized membrane protein YuzA (DUF378 family)
MSFADRFQGVWSSLYLQKFLYKLAMVLLVAGALNWLFLALFDTNVVESLLGKTLANGVYILVGISSLAIMFDRDTYLPFLGPTLAPCSVLQNREPPGATKDVKVLVSPNSKVLYWAAEPSNESLKSVQSWMDAYKKYENAGVATANSEGVAILKVRDPQSYKVPFMGKLESHVHYRVCGESGFMARVQTAYIDQKGPEGFEYNAAFADSAASLHA